MSAVWSNCSQKYTGQNISCCTVKSLYYSLAQPKVWSVGPTTSGALSLQSIQNFSKGFDG
jgi:hypothetical protein